MTDPAISKLGSISCTALTAVLGEQKVASPGTDAYNASLNSLFSKQQSALQPACIVFPQTAQDVSAAVVSLVNTEHDGRKCPFAIRAGGHQSYVGASNIADGVVLDLRALNTVELNENKSIVSVGAGTLWDAVYEKLDPLDLSVNGGRAAGVGVGGLTLGGGISYFSARYGWTCDSVVNFEVVLADGSVVEANTSVNQDLFIALKGGSNNFGVVTRIDFNTFEQGPFWTGQLVHTLEHVDEAISEFVKINSADQYDENVAVIMSFGYLQARDMPLMSNLLYYTKGVESPPIFDGVLKLPNIMSKTDLMKMSGHAKATRAMLPADGLRSLNLVMTLHSKAAVIKSAHNHFIATINTIKHVPNIIWSMALEPLPPAIYARHSKDNALGLTDRTESLVVALIVSTWSNAEDDELVYKTANSLLKAINDEAAKLGGLDPYVCMSYAGKGQDPISSYGVDSMNQLLQVRERVDPGGVFASQVPGGYKIPNKT